MKIGIIGAGNIGSTLATHFVRLGHEVRIANSRGPETLRDVEAKTGARAATAEDALRGVDIAVVTIPMKDVPQLSPRLFRDLPENTVVIDTCNYYPDTRDGTIPELEGVIPESKWVEERIGHAVVKAFNNIMAPHLAARGQKRDSHGRIALPVAGDDLRAKRAVMSLVDAIGFDPVDAGTIAESWRQQQGTPVYGTELNAAGVSDALERADHDRLVELRRKNETIMKKMMKGAAPDDVVQALRDMHAKEDRRKAA